MLPAAQPNPAPVPPSSPQLWVAKDLFGGPDYVVRDGVRRGSRSRGPRPALSKEEWDRLMARKWLGAWDAGSVIGCSDEHIYHLIECGELRATNLALPNNSGRGCYRIDTAEIRRFLERRQVGMTESQPKATS